MVWMVVQATIYFDSLNERCANLNQKLASAAMFLPAYQLRQRQQVQLNFCSGRHVYLLLKCTLVNAHAVAGVSGAHE